MAFTSETALQHPSPHLRATIRQITKTTKVNDLKQLNGKSINISFEFSHFRMHPSNVEHKSPSIQQTLIRKPKCFTDSFQMLEFRSQKLDESILNNIELSRFPNEGWQPNRCNVSFCVAQPEALVARGASLWRDHNFRQMPFKVKTNFKSEIKKWFARMPANDFACQITKIGW